MLQRLARRHNTAVLSTAAATLKDTLTNLACASALDELRGFEGSAAKVYSLTPFQQLRRVIC